MGWSIRTKEHHLEFWAAFFGVVYVCVCVHAHSEVSGRERVGKGGLGVFFPHSAVRSRSTSKGGSTGM